LLEEKAKAQQINTDIGCNPVKEICAKTQPSSKRMQKKKQKK